MMILEPPKPVACRALFAAYNKRKTLTNGDKNRRENELSRPLVITDSQKRRPPTEQQRRQQEVQSLTSDHQAMDGAAGVDVVRQHQEPQPTTMTRLECRVPATRRRIASGR